MDLGLLDLALESRLLHRVHRRLLRLVRLRRHLLDRVLGRVAVQALLVPVPLLVDARLLLVLVAVAVLVPLLPGSE